MLCMSFSASRIGSVEAEDERSILRVCNRVILLLYKFSSEKIAR
jgi:hypothetical protein